MSDLLYDIFSDLREGEYIELMLLSADKQVTQHFWFQDVDSFLERAREYSGKFHCFFGPAPRKEKGSTKESVSRLTCVWTDVDAKDFGSKANALGALDNCPLPWSYVVDSGHGYHAYLLLSDSMEPETGERVMRAIKNLVGGDHTQNCNRLLRIPGTLNIKENPTVECRVIGKPGFRYPSSDVIKMLLELSTQSRQAINEGKAPSFAKDKSRSGIDYAVLTELRRLGVTEATRKIIWLESNKTIGEKAREDPGYYERTEHKLDQQSPEDKPVMNSTLVNAAAQFIEGQDMWLTADGQTILSTFVFVPERLFRGTDTVDDMFIGTIRTGGQEWDGVILRRKCFNRPELLNSALPRAECIWFGTDKQTRQLLPYLVAQWQKRGGSVARLTEVLGRHGDLWVSENCTLSKDKIMGMKDAPIVYTETGRVHPNQVLTPPPDAESFQEFLCELSNLLPNINHPEVSYPILGWFMAAPFKPVLQGIGVRFPHLDLYGTKGSGKSSTLEECYLRLAGYQKPQSHNCSTTDFVLLSLWSSTNAIPVSLAEFRRSTLPQKNYAVLQRLLLTSYDYSVDARGRANQTTKDYVLDAPIVLTGEDVIDDPAIKERTIFCSFKKGTVAENSACFKAFKKLIELELEWFALPYIQWTLGFNQSKVEELWTEAYGETRKVFPGEIEDRLRRNLATVLFGIRMWERFLAQYQIEVQPASPEVLSQALSEVHDEQRGRAPVTCDEYIEELVNHICLSGNPQFICRYDDRARILWFKNTSAYSWWARDRHLRGQPSLELSAIKAQLKELTIDPNNPQPGRYIVAPRAINVKGENHHMHGLDLAAARAANLDVPESLNLQQVLINLDTGR